MSPPLVAQPLNPLAWLAAPAAAAMAAAVILTAPLEIAGVGVPQPVLPMACAFAWAVIRPSILAPFALLALGLFQDLLWGDRLGLWAAGLLTAHGLAASARTAIMGHGFWGLWGWYMAASAAGFAVAYGLGAVSAGQAPDLVMFALQYAATAAIFWFAWKLIEHFEDADVRFR